MRPKKLTLKKESLSELTNGELAAVVGGTDTNLCWVKTFTQFSVCSLC